MKKTLRHATAGLLAAALLLALAGCSFTSGSYSLTNYSEDSGGDYWRMEHEYFNGYQQKKVVWNGEPFTLDVDITTLSGSIALTVSGERGVYYQEKNIGTSAFTVEVPDEVAVTIRVEAEDHQGGFSFRWQ